MRPLMPKSHRDQRGVTMIWLALFLLVMLAFVSLGIDMAKLMATRTQLQNAADAAALAGASAFSSGNGAAVADTAKARAIRTASYNKAFTLAVTPVVVDPSDVDVNLDSATVEVTARREGAESMVTHFLRVIGLPALGMRATAVAKAEGGCPPVLPLAVQPPLGQQFVPGCANQYTLKWGPPNGVQGGYGALDLPPCPGDTCQGQGGNAFKCEVASGYSCCVDSGTCIPSEPGNKSGPTIQGIKARFAADTDPDTTICYWQYHGNGMREITVPLTGPKEGAGGGCYRVYRLGVFFLTKIPESGGGSNIIGEFLRYEAASNGPSAGPFVVRLIR